MEHRCTQTEDKLNDKLNDEKIFVNCKRHIIDQVVCWTELSNQTPVKGEIEPSC